MTSDLLFLDVETPNGHNDRISSIGLVRTDCNGIVLEKKSYLVNPEEPFSDINMNITGICPSDVRNAPTFPEAWEASLKPVFADALLVAHNAAFDLSVLWKIFAAYSLGTPDWNYTCTKMLAKQWHPEFPNYKLPMVCRCLGFEMGTHHRALDDADACREIFYSLIGENISHVPLFCSYRPGHKKARYSAGPSAPKTSQKKFPKKLLITADLSISAKR